MQKYYVISIGLKPYGANDVYNVHCTVYTTWYRILLFLYTHIHIPWITMKVYLLIKIHVPRVDTLPPIHASSYTTHMHKLKLSSSVYIPYIDSATRKLTRALLHIYACQ